MFEVIGFLLPFYIWMVSYDWNKRYILSDGEWYGSNKYYSTIPRGDTSTLGGERECYVELGR